MLSDIMINILFYDFEELFEKLFAVEWSWVQYDLETSLQHDIPVRKYLFIGNNKDTKTTLMNVVLAFLQ